MSLVQDSKTLVLLAVLAISLGACNEGGGAKKPGNNEPAPVVTGEPSDGQNGSDIDNGDDGDAGDAGDSGSGSNPTPGDSDSDDDGSGSDSGSDTDTDTDNSNPDDGLPETVTIEVPFEDAVVGHLSVVFERQGNKYQAQKVIYPQLIRGRVLQDQILTAVKPETCDDVEESAADFVRYMNVGVPQLMDFALRMRTELRHETPYAPMILKPYEELLWGSLSRRIRKHLAENGYQDYYAGSFPENPLWRPDVPENFNVSLTYKYEESAAARQFGDVGEVETSFAKKAATSGALRLGGWYSAGLPRDFACDVLRGRLTLVYRTVMQDGSELIAEVIGDGF